MYVTRLCFLDVVMLRLINK